MTLATEYTDYVHLPAAQAAQYDHCSPNLLANEADLMHRFAGTKDNGCWGPRPIRGGVAPSIHGFAALDLSYRGLSTATGKEIAELCRAESKERGLQAVHDYARSRIWRPNRDPKVYPDGWKIQPRDAYGMGWGDWVHLETYASMWHNATPIVDRLGGVAPIPVRPVVGPGDKGDLVVAVQFFLLVHANQGAVLGSKKPVDGVWGDNTSKAWRNLVVWVNAEHPGAMTPDGRVDGVDWNVIAWMSGGWDGLYSHGFPVGV